MVVYMHEFTVKPRGGITSFPIDMLRYDSCYPDTSEDASKISITHDGSRNMVGHLEIKLRHLGEKQWVPTAGRWDSFCWTVIDHQKRKW